MSGQNNYGYGNTNPYQENYEMNNYNNYHQSGAGGVEESDDFVKFMHNISDINNELDNYNELIQAISKRQQSLLTQISEEEETFTRKQLDQLISELNSLQLTLKTKIKNLQQALIGDSNKIAQLENAKDNFLKLIQEYRIKEANYRNQNRVVAERQYRIVKPDATDEEVKDLIEDAGGQQIFSTLLLNANRRGEAKTLLHEVQQRHRELQRLEKTMLELTQLFHDMEELVLQQDEQIDEVHEQVQQAQGDIEQGLGHTNKGLISLKKARRKKCWCLLICIIIVIIAVAAIVGGIVGSRN